MKWMGPAIALAVALLPGVASAALAIGELAPDFRASAALAGRSFEFALADARARGPVVVYFYPAAYTRGCNLQAHTFALEHDRFSAAGATVVGVSLDSLARLERFSADPDYCAGKIAVVSDPDGRIARAYALRVAPAMAGLKDTRGAEIGHGFAERTTFVVAPDGRIGATIGGLSPEENVEAALAAVRRLAAGR